jgi:hypothetical protein
MPRGWLTFPIAKGIRLGISPTRSWLSFPLFGGIRSGVSIPIRRRKYTRVLIVPSPQLSKPGRMPGALVDD